MQNSVLITKGMRPFAQRVAKLLIASYRPLFGSAEDVPDVLLNQGNFLQIPPVTKPTFMHELLKHCLDKGVAAVLPLGMEELHPLAEVRPLFAEYGVDVWVPELSELADTLIVENPPSGLPLTVLPTGVYTQSDIGEEVALCCIAD